MAINDKASLKLKAASWFRRTGNATYEAEVDDIISLAEGRLNREIGVVETDITRTGTVDSRSISISAVSIAECLAMWVTDPAGGDEIPMQEQAAGNIPAAATSGRPTIWTMDSDTAIKFERPCDQAYGFRIRVKQRFALDADGDTNWLLDNHSDVYLAATLMWGAAFLEWGEHAALWNGVLERGIPQVRNELANRKKSVLRVDPALRRMGGGRSTYDIRRG